MKFRLTDELDYRTLERWIDRDFFHYNKMDPTFWLDQGSLCLCFEDKHGEVLFLRADRDGDFARLHMQFPPEEEVSKFRIAKALLVIFDPIVKLAKQYKGYEVKGIIFQSVNDSLIHFMMKKGFVACGNDDYLLQLENN